MGRDGEFQATLAVLAGGRGSRMGGPKSQLRIGDRPILIDLFERLVWPGPTLLVTSPGREHPPGHESYDREVTDPVADEGPARGIVTALESSRTPTVIFLTLDMPRIARAHLEYILDRLRRSPNAHGIMLRRRVDAREQVEPFPCGMRTSAASVIAARLKQGHRSISDLVGVDGFSAIAAPSHWPGEIWTNLNTPEDLRIYRQRR